MLDYVSEEMKFSVYSEALNVIETYENLIEAACCVVMP